MWPLGPGAMLAVICVAAFAVRVAQTMFLPNAVHADELLQYTEQAYRVVYHHGLIPWEYRIGARSWLIPGLLLPWMALCRSLSADPETIRVGVGVIASALSVVAVFAAFVLGRRSSLAAGFWAAGLVAFWPEAMFYSAHILADTVSAVPLIAGLALAYRRAPSPRGLVAAGTLFALTVLVRPQLAPAVAVAVLWTARLDWRRYGAFVLGALPALLLFAAVDAATWGTPFRSLVRYIYINQAGMAATFGVLPASTYARFELGIWSVASVLILGTAAFGVRRAPLLAVMTVVIVATFSAVGHKEMRFIYPALPLLLTLCGIGTAELIAIVHRRVGVSRTALWVPCGAAVFWLLGMGWSAAQPALRNLIVNGVGVQHAVQAINADRSVCGVAVLPANRWYEIGHARVREDIGLYAPASGAAGGAAGGPRSYNAVIVFQPDAPSPPTRVAGGFRSVACFRGGGQVCLYRVAAPCAPGADAPLRGDPDPAVARVLARARIE